MIVFLFAFSSNSKELKQLEEELDDTKRLYVEACERRDAVEEELNKKWQTLLSEQLDEVR